MIRLNTILQMGRLRYILFNMCHDWHFGLQLLIFRPIALVSRGLFLLLRKKQWLRNDDWKWLFLSTQRALPWISSSYRPLCLTLPDLPSQWTPNPEYVGFTSHSASTQPAWGSLTLWFNLTKVHHNIWKQFEKNSPDSMSKFEMLLFS